MNTADATGARPPEGEALDAARDFLRGWDRFWFLPSDPTTIGLIRLLTGLVLLYSHWCYSFDLLSYVSPQMAWLDREAINQKRYESLVWDFPDDFPWIDAQTRLAQPAMTVFGKGQASWSAFFHLDEPRSIWTAHIVILLVLLLFTIGLATRITSVLALLGALSYVQRAQTSYFGMDSILVVLLFYLTIAPSGAALSLDRWLEVRRERRRLRQPNAVVPLQPRISATIATRLMQIHFCLVYIASGTSKFQGAAWWNGNAVWGCFANYSFAPLRVPLYMDFIVFLCQHRWLWEIAMTGGVVFTLVMELSFPFLVWLKRWRWLMLTGAVLLHTGIGLIMGLVTFSLLMLCLVLSFAPPEATRFFLGRVAENCRGLAQAVFSPAAEAVKPQPAPSH